MAAQMPMGDGLVDGGDAHFEQRFATLPGSAWYSRENYNGVVSVGLRVPRPRRHAGYGVRLERTPHLRLPRHSAGPDADEWRDWVENLGRPIAIDLFCGGGGLSLGLDEAGFEVVLAVDTDPWALETHGHNFRALSLGLDLACAADVQRLLNLFRGLEVDLVAGSPPCQPYSRAGRSKIRSLVEAGERESEDHRRELWRSFLAVVEALRPKAALMENVPDMALGDDFFVLRHMADRLERARYEVEFAILDAWRHGVPQHRQRLFFVAVRDGRPFEWPKPGSEVNLRDAMGDLPRLGAGTGERVLAYRGPRTLFQEAARLGMEEHSDVVWDHVTRPVRSDDRLAFQWMTSKSKYTDLPVELQRYRGDIFDDKYKKLDWKERSRSITAHIAKDGYWYIHPEEPRTLTVREAARIQTFPDRFRFAGSRSHAFVQIGNAVPPKLAAAVASSVLDATRNPPTPLRNRPGHILGRQRQRLLRWTEKDRQQAPWRYPGEPWEIIVGTLLESRPTIGYPSPPDFLELFPTPASVSHRELDRLARRADNATQRAGVRRLGRIAARLTHHDVDKGLLADLPLYPAERDRLGALMLGDGRLVISAPALRVIARLTGTEVQKRNRLTEGRLLLARFVGASQNAPALNAGLAALGSTVCTASRPACHQCPLRSGCVSSSEKL